MEHHPLSKTVLEQVVRWGEQKKVCVILEGERESFSVGGDLPSAREMLKRRELPAITKVTFCCSLHWLNRRTFLSSGWFISRAMRKGSFPALTRASE